MWSFLELVVCDLPRSQHWYTTYLDFKIILEDTTWQFVLLQGVGFRLALKAGQRPTALCAVRLHLEVQDLHDETERLRGAGYRDSLEPKTSTEGYERIKLTDPDGNEVVLFVWQSQRRV
jgi:catechol 2,3-dioxygenase-like lactoylglutathione lyase family enzyme